jgi:thiol:disulfide interchange protein DsbD
MRLLRIVSLAAVVSAAWPQVSSAQPARKVSAPHVTVELISSQPALRAGGDTWLGLRFILEPGWHVYWLNPGDSGGPPTAMWQPDAGLTPRDFEWPVPKRIPYGPLVNYGYYGDVVLPFRVSAAAGSSAGSLSANVSWLVCKEICVAGKGRLSIAFPLAGDAAAAVPAWRAMIDEARGRVPRPAPASWRVDVQDGGEAFLVSVVTGQREAGGTFFPMQAGVLDEPAPQHPEPAERGLRLRLKKSDLLTTTPDTLRGVLTLDSGASHVVTLPLGAASRKGR